MKGHKFKNSERINSHGEKQIKKQCKSCSLCSITNTWTGKTVWFYNGKIIDSNQVNGKCGAPPLPKKVSHYDKLKEEVKEKEKVRKNYKHCPPTSEECIKFHIKNDFYSDPVVAFRALIYALQNLENKELAQELLDKVATVFPSVLKDNTDLKAPLAQLSYKLKEKFGLKHRIIISHPLTISIGLIFALCFIFTVFLALIYNELNSAGIEVLAYSFIFSLFFGGIYARLKTIPEFKNRTLDRQ
jgi:hypothetical protein